MLSLSKAQPDRNFLQLRLKANCLVWLSGFTLTGCQCCQFSTPSPNVEMPLGYSICQFKCKRPGQLKTRRLRFGEKEMLPADVIEQAKKGNTAALETLYYFYKRRVYALCFRMTKNVLDSEDLTQEVFLQVYR